MIALQYHEVKISLELRDAKDCYWAGAASSAAGSVAGYLTDLSKAEVGSLKAASLFVDYIYLDTEERRRFAQVSHEYLNSALSRCKSHLRVRRSSKRTIRVEKQPEHSKIEISVSRKQVSGLYLRIATVASERLINSKKNEDACNTAKLLETLKVQDTKVGFERPDWLRAKLRYGENSWNGLRSSRAQENGQSASKSLSPPLCKDMGKVQRLNDGAGEGVQQTPGEPVRYSLAPGPKSVKFKKRRETDK